jgi:hypothetical protein
MGDSIITQMCREEIGLYDPEEEEEDDELVTGGDINGDTAKQEE